jgi:hypothetical protein
MIRRAIVASLFVVLLLVGFASRANAGAYRWCVNIGLSSSATPMRVCIPVFYLE